MKVNHLIRTLFQTGGVIISSCLAATPAWANLTVEQINSIAQQTTVLIAPALTQDLLQDLEANRNNPLANESSEGVWNPGSGVLIAQQGNQYFVLTVTHNFKQSHLDENLAYGIRTSDGRIHEVKSINDGRGCPLEGTVKQQPLMRFGCYSRYLPSRVAGLDLALVSFESEQAYPVASLGNPEQVDWGERVYVSGWPDPEKERTPDGACRGQIERRQRRLVWGPLTGKLDPNQGQNGYGIFYFDYTRPGMSGGPVFDSNGFVVGVHGRGSNDKGQLLKQYCAVEPTQIYESADLAASPAIFDPTILHSKYSSAQNLQDFPQRVNQVGVDVTFNQLPPDQEMIQRALITIPEREIAEGTADFEIREDALSVGGFDDPDDQIDNIYEGFQLKNLLRDEPSPGCRFLLLGDPCD